MLAANRPWPVADLVKCGVGETCGSRAMHVLGFRIEEIFTAIPRRKPIL